MRKPCTDLEKAEFELRERRVRFTIMDSSAAAATAVHPAIDYLGRTKGERTIRRFQTMIYETIWKLLYILSRWKCNRMIAYAHLFRNVSHFVREMRFGI